MIKKFNLEKQKTKECRIYDFASAAKKSQSNNHDADKYGRQSFVQLSQDLDVNTRRAKMKAEHKGMIFYMVLGAIYTITFLLLALMIKYRLFIHIQQNENKDTYRKKTDYISSVAKSDCYLCGNNKSSMLLSHWGEQNIGLINLNTFEYFKYELNRYDNNKNLIKEKVRLNHRFGYQKWTEENGSKVNYSYDMNRGYFTGSISIDENTPLQADKLKEFVCTVCLNNIMDQLYYDEPYCDIAFIDFNTKDIRVLNRNGLGLQFSDYYIAYHYIKEYNTFDFDGFYCPVRY